VSSFLEGKSILITGGTGSFGQTCAKYLLERTKVGRVVIFSRDEWKQWQMQQSDPIFRHPSIRFFLGDVRDEERLKLALHDVQYVIHAAALKQVPAAEYNPSEFIRTNVMGAMNLTAAALDAGVEGVVSLSSDKAVNPINLYGATKLCSDKLFIAANSYVGKRGLPRFSVVRYGNVLGSRGSLIPLWKALVAKGSMTLPITDPQMTRFWITLEDAVRFVIMALEEQAGGEIFVPKSPSVKIEDLAHAIFPHQTLQVIGIRPGEKIHETLISSDDARNTYEYQTHYRIAPAFSVHRTPRLEEALSGALRQVPDHFSLSSDQNPLFLSSLDEIKKLIQSADV
jgi:UDP-N-acetylglucosamine 4,6-dehydratase/5-epimerase